MTRKQFLTDVMPAGEDSFFDEAADVFNNASEYEKKLEILWFVLDL